MYSNNIRSNSQFDCVHRKKAEIDVSILEKQKWYHEKFTLHIYKTLYV